ncbi:MAG: hypothetical protein HUU55_06925 [Myxococcales bacterium]|nr:hypothetical protein [Myxococcales bacterium]
MLNRGFHDPAEFEPDRPPKNLSHIGNMAQGFLRDETDKDGQSIKIII